MIYELKQIVLLTNQKDYAHFITIHIDIKYFCGTGWMLTGGKKVCAVSLRFGEPIKKRLNTIPAVPIFLLIFFSFKLRMNLFLRMCGMIYELKQIVFLTNQKDYVHFITIHIDIKYFCGTGWMLTGGKKVCAVSLRLGEPMKKRLNTIPAVHSFLQIFFSRSHDVRKARTCGWATRFTYELFCCWLFRPNKRMRKKEIISIKKIFLWIARLLHYLAITLVYI